MPVIHEHLSGLPPLLVLAILGLSITGEVAMIATMALPGTTALLILGFFASAGVVGLVPAVGTALAAAVTGTTLGYLSGRRLGSRVRHGRWGRRISAERWARTERFFTRFGRRAVFFGQFVAVARTLAPRLAGMNGQPYRRFAAASLPAITVWAPGFVLAGYLAGASYAAVSSVFGAATIVLLVAAGTAVLLAAAGRWVACHPQPVHAAAAAMLSTRPARALAHHRDRWSNGSGSTPAPVPHWR